MLASSSDRDMALSDARRARRECDPAGDDAELRRGRRLPLSLSGPPDVIESSDTDDCSLSEYRRRGLVLAKSPGDAMLAADDPPSAISSIDVADPGLNSARPPTPATAGRLCDTLLWNDDSSAGWSSKNVVSPDRLDRADERYDASRCSSGGYGRRLPSADDDSENMASLGSSSVLGNSFGGRPTDLPDEVDRVSEYSERWPSTLGDPMVRSRCSRWVVSMGASEAREQTLPMAVRGGRPDKPLGMEDRLWWRRRWSPRLRSSGGSHTLAASGHDNRAAAAPLGDRGPGCGAGAGVGC